MLAQDRSMTVQGPELRLLHRLGRAGLQGGYDVTVVETADIAAAKASIAGVPEALWSRHTARIDGYVIEGTSLDAVARLLETRPDVTGISVPGMPMGSPGMGDDPAARYDVIAWGGKAGEGTLFQRVGDPPPDRQRGGEGHRPQRERRMHLRHPGSLASRWRWMRGEIVGVLRHHLQQVVGRTRHQVTFQHVGNLADLALEGLKRISSA